VKLFSTPCILGFASILLACILMGLPAARADSSPEALIKAGHWKRARPVVEKLYRDKPNDPEALYLLSQIKMAFADLEGALPLAEGAVSLDGRKAKYHYQLASVCGELADRASLFKKAGLAKRFKEEAEKAASLDPKNVDARFALMEFYRQAPHLMGGDKKKAHEMVRQIVEVDLVRGYLDAAILAQEEKDVSSAEAYYSKALAAGPKDYDALVAASDFYRDAAHRTDLAERYGRAAVRLDPGRAGGYCSLAALYAMQRRWSELDAVLVQSEKAVPDDLAPYYQAGSALLHENLDLPRAERYLRKYLTQQPEGDEPDLAHAHWQLGLVLEKQGRKQDAISEIQMAVQMDRNLKQASKDFNRLKSGG
jgi:tetratricopeptide (TPR) repeat protein